MMRRQCLLFCLALATFAPAAATRAEDPPAKLKTQAVSFRLVRADQDVKGLDRAIELVQIPAGTIVVKGPDGKEHEQAIKSVWVAKYETRWDEYNVFFMGLDMAEEQ